MDEFIVHGIFIRRWTRRISESRQARTLRLHMLLGTQSGVVISMSIRCQYLREDLRENCEIWN